MAFFRVYNALYDQLKASSYLSYVNQTQFLKGFHEGFPAQDYTIILEPGEEEEAGNSQTYEGKSSLIYTINIHIRVMLTGYTDAILISGDEANGIRGVLQVVDDIKMAIEEDDTLGYSRPASSVSAVNSGTSFDLTATKKYISISINGKTPSGYNTILCGSSTLTGEQVGANIQAALRALGNHAEDGYYGAICSFDNASKQFTIATADNHPDWSVTVTAGASSDCSALLGFDSPTEVNGRNISDVTFDTVIPNNTFWPVRYRVLPVKIWEEINRQGG